jgi:hypothetical protein
MIPKNHTEFANQYLTKPIAARYLLNIREQKAKFYNDCCPSCAMNRSFTFSRTKEGRAYWDSIAVMVGCSWRE